MVHETDPERSEERFAVKMAPGTNPIARLMGTRRKDPGPTEPQNAVLAAISEAVRVSPSTLMVHGWCARPADPVLSLSVNGWEKVDVPLRTPRPDVAARFGLSEDSLLGFRHYFQLGQDRFDASAEEIPVRLEIASPTGDAAIRERSWPIAELALEKTHWYARGMQEARSFTVWQHDLDPDLISVVLSVYNGEAYLREAIDSVLGQTDSGFEFIIVDDGSKDGSADIIREAAERDPRVRPILQPRNMGQGAGFNAGISAARGGHTCFMDADDTWFPHKLARLRTVFETCPYGVSLFQHNLEICRGEELTGTPFRTALISGDMLNHAREIHARVPGPFVPTAGLAFPTHVLRAVFPIPKEFRVCADGFLTRAAAAMGKSFAIDESLGAYRIHGGNNTIENSAFDSRDYVDTLLIPEMNRFYTRVGISARLPNSPPAQPRITLAEIEARKSGSGMAYVPVIRPDPGSLEGLRDIHKGRRGFIVATGPSLTVPDLDMLKDEITFSCNKITLAFGETDWRPTYYSIIDSVVSDTFDYDLSTLESVKLFPEDLEAKFGHLERTHFLKNRTPIHDNGERVFEFSTDLTDGCGGGFTVIYLLMQAAYHMGIDELYLLGLDFSFSFDKVSDRKSPKGEEIIESAGEQNHFHKDYRQKGDEWTYPRLDMQRLAFAKAKEAFEADERVILNASRRTALDLFDRVDLDDVLRSGRQDRPSRSSGPSLSNEGYGRVEEARYEPGLGAIDVRGWITPAPKTIDVRFGSQSVRAETVATDARPMRENTSFRAPLAEFSALVPLPTGAVSGPAQVIAEYSDGMRILLERQVAVPELGAGSSDAVRSMHDRLARQDRQIAALARQNADVAAALAFPEGSNGWLHRNVDRHKGETAVLALDDIGAEAAVARNEVTFVAEVAVHSMNGNRVDYVILDHWEGGLDLPAGMSPRHVFTHANRLPGGDEDDHQSRLVGVTRPAAGAAGLDYPFPLATRPGARLLFGKSAVLPTIQIAAIMGIRSVELLGNPDANVLRDLFVLRSLPPVIEVRHRQDTLVKPAAQTADS